ncbi:hypothetical protein HYU40_02310 [Candidatus Woesearchaeota archaeon]|nr:hypothetical protein [Candidatus Woesearchaeota archaeon]
MRKEAGISSASASTIAIFSALIASLLLVIAVAAQEEEEEVMVEEELVPEEAAGVTPDSPIYVFDKIVDDVQLALAKGEDKTKKALEIKEERIAEAAIMVDKKKPDAAKGALELAAKAAGQAQKELDPEFEKETNEKVRRAAKLLSGLQEKLPDQGWEGVEKALDAQLSEEEKVRVALLVSKSRLTYCDAIAQQDFDLMKQDELCQVEKAPQWLRERVEGEFKSREDKARNLIIDTVSSCVVDPKKCDCSQIPVGKHSQSCEVKKALAIRCEYENDESACSELASEKLEDFLPEFVGEEGKQTVLSHLREKEEQMFEKFKPPECANAQTFQECFAVMKDLYGTPMQCKGLSDDECMEFIKRNPPTEKPNLPPECNEAGVQKPVECAELMFSKYGTPPQCEGLDTRECMKLMRQERPDAMQNAMPKECQDAGAKEPRQCFDIMTAKFGFPPECEGLDTDSCFKEMMKRGPGEGPEGGTRQETPECQEKGVKGKDCFLLMTELYGGMPQECEGLSADECFEKVTKEGPPKGAPPVNCVGLSPEECRAKIQEQHGLPPECAQNPDQCQNAFEGRGVPGGIPAECAGLEPEQCELVMMQKFGPPECKEATKDECEAIMKEKYGEGGFGGGPGPGGPGQGGEGGFGFGGTGGGGFVNECEGLPREECENKMFEKFAPPECSGLSREECGRMTRGRFERERQEQDKNRGECEGLSEEECRGKFFEGRGEGDARGEGERREGGDAGAAGPQRTFREPLGEPIRGAPSGCEGLSPEECGSRMEQAAKERFIPQGEPIRREPQQQPYPAREYPAGSYPERGGEYPRGYQQPSGGEGSYPSSEGSYPGSGSGTSDGGSESSGGFGGDSGSPGRSDSGSGGGGSGGGEGTAAAITGQIIKAIKWVGGR